MKYIEIIKRFFISYKKKIILILLIVFLIVIFLLSSFLIYKVNKGNNAKESKVSDLIPELTTIKEDNKEVEKVYVDIKGYVKNPGVYEIESNKRVIDVISMAGGINKDANTKYLNMSKKITDEMVIIVYSNEEIEKLNVEEKIECNCEKITNDACLENTEEINLININTASLEELKKLDGIGDVKAKSIIDYREENGFFTTIEELTNVSGISENTYDKIKNFITTK